MKIFKEKLSTAVITTKWIIEKAEPILHVFHYKEDGMWEFVGITKAVEDSDVKVIGLNNIIAIDASLLEISDLPLGYRAIRKSIEDGWKISRIPNGYRHKS